MCSLLPYVCHPHFIIKIKLNLVNHSTCHSMSAVSWVLAFLVTRTTEWSNFSLSTKRDDRPLTWFFPIYFYLAKVLQSVAIQVTDEYEHIHKFCSACNSIFHSNLSWIDPKRRLTFSMMDKFSLTVSFLVCQFSVAECLHMRMNMCVCVCECFRKFDQIHQSIDILI